MILPHLSLALLFALAVPVFAATRYVDLNSPSPMPPYSSWATAATNIQDAVDQALVGDEVLVTNGVYATGGRAVHGTMTNRVAVTNEISVRSVNGPQFTVIEGWQVPGTTNGNGAIRCAYLASGAVLSGFTLTNGATRNSGDSNYEQNGGAIYCPATTATISNCVITRNAAYGSGGGVRSGSLWDCVVNGNVARSNGGGTFVSLIERCVVTHNRAGNQGGGVYLGAPQNCTIAQNAAGAYGGGVAGGGMTVQNCLISNNTATQQGGGAYLATLRNCAITGNSVVETGGGVYGATLYHCTVTGNTAGTSGGGGWGSSYYNCILYYNTAPLGPNYGGTPNYSCTVPLPATAAGNITNEPVLASAYHLSADSPCRGMGATSHASGVDIDGESWLNPPSMGCDEFIAGFMAGPLIPAVKLDYTNIAVGFTANLTAEITGHPEYSRWDFGDGSVTTNQPYTSHGWSAPGDYAVVLTVYNSTYPAGVSATGLVHVVEQPVHYVRASGSSPASPFATWASAANNIQSAVDAATVAGALVLVTNGTYSAGGAVVHGSMFNRVAVTKPITIQSVNGPDVTLIAGRKDSFGSIGDGAIRGVYLTNGARLSGFTVTNAATRGSGAPLREKSGGGVCCESVSAVVTNCVLIGNAAQSGGGIYGGTADQCRLASNTAGEGGGAHSAALNFCTLTNNSVSGSGGGASGGVLNDCVLVGNTASSGGGANGGVLTRCTLSNNVALYDGGGGNYSTLNYSLISSNAARSGGGAFGGTLNGCTVVSNVVANGGGGASGSNLRGCAISGNFAAYAGGGAVGGTVVNCTVLGNKAGVFAGGVASCTLTNCIVFFNSAPNGENFKAGTWNTVFYNSCTTPGPETGSGNFTAEPQLASLIHLSATSPCRGKGSPATAALTDIDGESWAFPPSIGCDEYVAGSVLGPLSVTLRPSFTNVAVGWPLDLTADIQGHASSSRWEFGDGTILSNRPYGSHIWKDPGNFPVVLRAYNETHPDGVTATAMVQVVEQPVHYVSLTSPTPVPPYSSWLTAATNIQDAVDAALVPGSLVVVSNGLYAMGGRVVFAGSTNRLAVTRPLVVRSLNGPGETMIQGYQTPGVIKGLSAIRCVYLGHGALLAGFTLTNGATRTAPVSSAYSDLEIRGGALICESASAVASNCVLIGSAGMFGGGIFSGTLVNCVVASNSANFGGGAHSSTLINTSVAGNLSSNHGGGTAEVSARNCLLVANRAGKDGGGAYQSTLNNCTVYANTATNYGSGANETILNNCIIYYNSSPLGGQNFNSILNHSCSPNVYGAVNSFTNEPGFVDPSAVNLRLQPDSPCINAGGNVYVNATFDLGGNPRIAGGTVDIGAYEFQSPSSVLSYAWAQQYGLPTDGSADFIDDDADGMNNYGEWSSDTIPTNALSVLRMVAATNSASGATVTWHSVATRSYWLERATNLGVASSFQTVATNIFGVAGSKTFTDTTATNGGPYFYRVGVQ